MKNYLYILNYPPEDKALCQLEFKSLFHQPMTSQYFLSSKDISVDTSVFFKGKIDIFDMDQDFTALIEKLKKQNLYYLDFKVIYIKNSDYHLDYHESLQKCKDLSWAIDGSVNMAKPQHTIAIMYIEGMWICGYYHHGKPSWKKHDDKPRTFSNSLDIRLARTLINIGGQNQKDKTIVDPCCGMATVVLEALALGYQVSGFDISRDISWHARKNLEYYGYDPQIIQRSAIEDIQGHYDVAIIDIPYNLYTPITRQQQLSIIQASRKICDRLVFVSYEEMDQDLIDYGYTIIEKCLRKKTEYVKFGRYIYVCQ